MTLDSAVQADAQYLARLENAGDLMAQWAREDAAADKARQIGKATRQVSRGSK